jgi:hypothetical protein
MLVKVTRAIFQTPFEFFARSLETRRNNKGNNNNKKKKQICWGGKAEVMAGKIFMRVEKYR